MSSGPSAPGPASESPPPAASLATAPPRVAEAPVVFERVHARSDEGSGGPLVGATLTLGAGVHAILGRPEDGTATLIDAVAGRVAIRSGRLRVAGGSPSADPAVRARIVCLADSPALGPGRTVADLVQAVRRWRGGLSPEPLELLGMPTLERRSVRALTRRQARGLELALALGVGAPAVLALYEPRSDVPTIDVARLQALVRERARAGACVIVATSSPRDAALLGADDVLLLRAGRIAGPPLPAGWGVGAGQELVLWVDGSHGGGARALAAALGQRDEIGGVSWQRAAEPGRPALVAVRTVDVARGAVAIAQEATRLGTAILQVQTQDPGLDDLARWAIDAERLARSSPPAPNPPEPAAPRVPVTEGEP